MRIRAIVLVTVAAVVGAACGRSSSGTQGTSDTTTSSAPTSVSTKSANFGTLKNVCTSGHPSGSPTTGVTASEIHVATFSDRGFVGRPGLNQEFFDTADVFAAWCNDRGGINGRKIVVDKRDAALFDTKARMVESCSQDFALVAGGATFDQNGVETRLKCLLPDFAGFVVSAPRD